MNDIKTHLTALGQGHLLRFYDELDEEQRKNIEKELCSLDYSVLDITDNEQQRGRFDYLPAMTIEQINEKRAELTELGLDAIRQGKVGAVLLAGGMGSRLGADVPKGAFDIGVTRHLYIFECLINNLLDVVRQAGEFLPLFIMTSRHNDEQTREFLKSHDYFGYDSEHIHFFIQEQLPVVDTNGKLMLSAKDKVACAPNGNGGWYISMRRSGIFRRIKNSGKLEMLNVFAVDNVLQRMADPCFIGALISSGKACGAKVVKKAAPDENVGVICLEDGRPSIVEYYELTDEMRTRRAEDGSLYYKYGVILNYLFRIDELDKAFGISLPVHRAFKQVSYIDENGSLVRPSKPNAYKFETLVLDLVRLQSSCLPFEVEREKEFAPVKNKTGIDSVESARELLRANGVEL